MIVQRVKVVVDEMLDHVDALMRIIATDHIGLPKELVGVDQSHHQAEEYRRHHEREGDVEEAAGIRSTVQLGIFVVDLFDAHPPCQVQQKVVAGITNYEHHNQIYEGKGRAVGIHRRQIQSRQTDIQ